MKKMVLRNKGKAALAYRILCPFFDYLLEHNMCNVENFLPVLERRKSCVNGK